MDDEKEIELEEEVIEEEGLQDKIKKMREELKVCRKEKEEYLSGWQRAKADFINARKDEEKAKEIFVKFAEAGLLNEILAIADSLDMAMKHKAADGTKEIYDQLKDVLKKHGVTPIEAIGKKFNPAEHEAIKEEEVDSQEKDNAVVEELQRGWYLHDKVLRPSKVKVGIYKAN
ncbi:nucleotide exchange factor GrpE [Candidatus Giovannonibacteria bacterium RIFCSPLOWO2_01_FULL_46_13]|uniref:Protein GrpE n=1 Tax=Candidatus Giovannonibacteria bacterium RIFCSPLOWO2_01_FULL_46_13 TaxID=1798352 RepID=A0A1F5X3Q0_9BACT|nr:MAG: nucleotide exchange factor GrpE [Candidatus Giovannonibacteria bacterium RIFCSPLOWO2_01_FULL_46_13]